MTGAAAIGGGDARNTIVSFDRELVDMSRTMMTLAMSAIMVVFAAIIVIVCLLVIRFRIVNNIEEDMPKIGSLQSVGYTSKQVMLSIITQYGIIAFIGSLSGILPAYLSLPWVSDVFAAQTGLLWRQGFDPVINLISIGTLLLVVTLVSFTAAFRIKKIAPVQALRGGISTHNFKKNYLPLEKNKLPLIMTLSFKAVMQNIKQSMMVFIVLTAIAFAATFAIIAFYNSAINTRAFSEIPGTELSNAYFILTPGEDTEVFRNKILAHPDVRKAEYLDAVNIMAEDTHVIADIMQDYALKETNVLYAGRYPLYDNEACISSNLAKLTEKGIGDTILVGEEEVPFIITGLPKAVETAG
jgi:putative ABC transport system permease protein